RFAGFFLRALRLRPRLLIVFTFHNVAAARRCVRDPGLRPRVARRAWLHRRTTASLAAYSAAGPCCCGPPLVFSVPPLGRGAWTESTPRVGTMPIRSRGAGSA